MSALIKAGKSPCFLPSLVQQPSCLPTTTGAHRPKITRVATETLLSHHLFPNSPPLNGERRLLPSLTPAPSASQATALEAPFNEEPSPISDSPFSPSGISEAAIMLEVDEQQKSPKTRRQRRIEQLVTSQSVKSNLVLNDNRNPLEEIRGDPINEAGAHRRQISAHVYQDTKAKPVKARLDRTNLENKKRFLNTENENPLEEVSGDPANEACVQRKLVSAHVHQDAKTNLVQTSTRTRFPKIHLKNSGLRTTRHRE